MKISFSKHLGAAAALAAWTMAAGFANAQQAPPVYSLTDLGSISADGVSRAWGINDRGDVVGASGNGAFPIGFVWRSGVMSSIGTLRGGRGSSAVGISPLGQIVGLADNSSSFSQAVVVRNNTLLNIAPSGAFSTAFSISDAGVVVGDYAKGGSSATWVPAIWTEDPRQPGRFRQLDLTTAPGDFAFARAANQSQIVVGNTQGLHTRARAACWNNDAKHTISTLEPVPGDLDSDAFGVNDLGVTVGVSWFGIYHSEPTVWSADPAHTPTALPLLPGDLQGFARSINSHGQVIGDSGQAVGAAGAIGNTPVTWINGQVFAVQSALDANSQDWQITDILAINNGGQIVGNGIHNGVIRAFLLTPAVP